MTIQVAAMALQSNAAVLSSAFFSTDMAALTRTRHESNSLKSSSRAPRCVLQPELQQAPTAKRRTVVASSTVVEQAVKAGAASTAHLQVEPLKESSLQGLDRQSGMQVMLSAVIDMAEKYVIPLMEPRERTSRTDPRVQLGGNFAPVEESPAQKVLEVKGTIPKCLNGAYIRNGGNPKFTPTAGFHYFDGDGMLHVVRIKDGAATHCCRFVQTNRSGALQYAAQFSLQWRTAFT